MSDFSSFALFTAGLAILTKSTAAQITVPGGNNPTAGAILTPGTGAVLTAGTPYTITWDYKPAGCGETIDLALVKKVATADYVDGYAWIERGVSNKRKSYSWTPSTTLEPGDNLYGIELVCVDTQAYQYSPRFGLTNTRYGQSPGSSSTSGKSSSAATTSSATTSSHSGSASGEPKYPHHNNATTPAIAAPYPMTTGAAGNATGPERTGSSSIVTAIVTATSGPTTAVAAAPTASAHQSGATGTFKASFVGLVVAAAIAVFAF